MGSAIVFPYHHLLWRGFFLLMVAGLAAIGGGATAKDSAPDLKLTRVDYLLDVLDFFIADVDGDSVSELVRLFSDRRTYHATRFSRERFLGTAICQGNSAHRICALDPVEVDTTPGTELALVKRDDAGDSMWVEIVAGANPKQLLGRTTAIRGTDISDRDNHRSPGWDGYVEHVHACDLDHDGRPEIILPLGVGFDLYPRGIYVYDYPSGRLRWRFLLAGNPLSLSFADGNKDGKEEIYFKTWSSDNGAVVADQSDSTAYAFALNYEGKVLWRQCLGDRFDFQTGNVRVCDCDHDSIMELYYSVLISRERFDRQVRILEKRSALDYTFIHQRSFDADHEYHEISHADLNGDHTEELLINDRPTVLDPVDLSVISTGPLQRISIVDIANLIGDRESVPEVVAIKSDSLYILDHAMNVLVAYADPSGGQFENARHFRHPLSGEQYLGAIVRLGVPEGAMALSAYRLSVIVPPGILSRLLVAVGRQWPGIMVGLALGAAVVLIARRRRGAAPAPRRQRTERFDTLLSALTAFDHGQMAGKNLDRLIFLFSNLPDSSPQLTEIRPNLHSAIQAYQTFTCGQLENIAAHARRLKQLRPVIQMLARQTRKLTALLDQAAVTDLMADQPRLNSEIPATADKIKQALKQIKKAVQAYFAVDLLRVIPNVLSASAIRLRQQGVGFSDIVTSGTSRNMVFFADAELAVILDELITNACDAMMVAEKRELSLYVGYRDGEAVIRLSDTGCGLPVDDVEQILNREFSTKGKNRGYGLYHARQQVERFGGRIRIDNNEHGPGATVQLTLKTIDYE